MAKVFIQDIDVVTWSKELQVERVPAEYKAITSAAPWNMELEK